MIEILSGVISGIISGTGMGGGTILIFLLTFMCGVEQHIAQATNLIFFIPTSIVAIIVNIKNKNINLNLAMWTPIFRILGPILGANIAIKMDLIELKKYFGYFLAIIALNEIYTIYKQYKKEKNTNNNIK